MFKTLNQFNALWEWDFASILSNDKLSDVRIATQAVFWLLSILSFAIVFCLIFYTIAKNVANLGRPLLIILWVSGSDCSFSFGGGGFTLNLVIFLYTSGFNNRIYFLQ